MRHRLSRLLFIGLLAAFSLAALPARAGPSNTTFVYAAVVDYGRVTDMNRKAVDGFSIQETEDGANAYLLKKVPITDEAQLLRLMGTTDESRLTDVQKGILEVYRAAQTDQIKTLDQYGPEGSRAVTVNLVDISGCNDRTRFPGLRQNFWPHARKSTTYSGNKTTSVIDVVISGVDNANAGAQTAKEMKVTFAHEFGHTLDLTNTEPEPYGPDGDHWHNEVIKPKAAFAEGFANFVSTLVYPERSREFRQALSQVQYETASRTYQRFAPTAAEVKPTDLLNIEAVVSLILTRISRDLPDGRDKVFAAFRATNSWKNDLKTFLQRIVADNPSDAYAITQILDEETYKRLSNQEIRSLLGSNSEVEAYLKTRRDPAPNTPKVVRATPTEAPSGSVAPVANPPSGGRARIYKWKDESGRMHFTDSPPPPGVSYTTMAPQKLPNVRTNTANPFSGD